MASRSNDYFDCQCGARVYIGDQVCFLCGTENEHYASQDEPEADYWSALAAEDGLDGYPEDFFDDVGGEG